jgi:hypothetical protein
MPTSAQSRVPEAGMSDENATQKKPYGPPRLYRLTATPLFVFPKRASRRAKRFASY